MNIFMLARGVLGVFMMERAFAEISHHGFADLVAQIEHLSLQKSNMIVGITGFGGSGKSTLADRLGSYFKVKEEQRVSMDLLYGPNRHGPDIFDQNNWDLLIRILEDSRTGKKLLYQGKDDKGLPVQRDELLPKILIVEGVRLLQPRLMKFFDISVWIDCSQEYAIQRAKNRDRAQGEDELTVNLWDTDWGPKDKTYFEKFRPDLLASFIYKEYK